MTVNRLKRTLWPLRPVLLPVWHALAPWRDRLSADFPPPRPKRPIWPLTASQFHELLQRDKYYVGRAGYMGTAAKIAAELIERHDLRTALELGPNIRPLVRGADAMDFIERPGLEAEGSLIVHDATVAPWPIPDRRYDLFVGLQVFEHLGSRQDVAFAEVARVARHAILSLPIDWEMADPRNVHHQLSNERVLSWFGSHTPTRVVEGTPAPKKRLIYVFENLGEG
jgi:hypothetical protein